jgi:hypothetical protein
MPTSVAYTPKNTKIFVYQIFYDQESKQRLNFGFIPLDNTDNERPDWYEFWVIRKFLKTNELESNSWYGFLSPKFVERTGFQSLHVLNMLEKYDAFCDVALFSPGWDQLAYFLNPFEQGEVWHPGLKNCSQRCFDEIGIKIDLNSLVTYSKTSVFSNYIIAKPKFWNHWLSIAEQFYELAERNVMPELKLTTNYGSRLNQAPMKTFIQERIASIVLAQGDFKAMPLDHSQNGPIYTRIFKNDPATRRMLQSCDLLKEKYCLTKDDAYLEMYYRIRKDIEFTEPKEPAI